MKGTMFSLKNDQYDFYYLLALMFLLFAVAPLYFQPNFGGTGLDLTFNLATWAVASVIIVFTILLMTARTVILLPDRYLYFVAVPAVIILFGLFTEVSQPAAFFFTELYVSAGLLFLFALFQFSLKKYQVEWVLLVIVLSTLTHSVMGMLQIFNPEILGQSYASNNTIRPHGIFQQINNQASFLATGVAIGMYLLSRPIAKQFSWFISGLLILSLGLSSYLIVYSGSRVGLLGLALSVILLVAFRLKQLMSNKRLVILAIVVISTGVFSGKSGVKLISLKTTGIPTDIATDIAKTMGESPRFNIYRIGLELVAQKPLQGHGIGSFSRVWNLQTSDYSARYPEAVLEPHISHPHNELLYWIIEGGILIISGMLAAIVAVVLALIQCGKQRSAGYVSMLLPITLHTQLEQPFYISSLHWFVWLLLIFIVIRHRLVTKKILLSSEANRLLQFTSVLVLIFSLYFLYHTSRAQVDIIRFRTHQPSETPYLEIALRNYYYRDFAVEMGMRQRLHTGLSSDNADLIRSYIPWATNRIEIKPELFLFGDLVMAYIHLKDEQSKCEVIQLGINMYPRNIGLVELNRSCILNNNGE
jgi:O-antigen polymerase